RGQPNILIGNSYWLPTRSTRNMCNAYNASFQRHCVTPYAIIIPKRKSALRRHWLLTILACFHPYIIMPTSPILEEGLAQAFTIPWRLRPTGSLLFLAHATKNFKKL